ncbi:MAG: HD domain-containing protein [Patescibacteria group bacterium]
MSKVNNRDIQLLFEISSLNNMARGWTQHVGMRTASIAEHTYRMMWIALLLAKAEGADEGKTLRMAFVHDIVETRISDLSYVQKVYVHADEEQAATEMFDGTSFGDYKELLDEYERRECLEAKIVKDADNLDVSFEIKELEARGSQVATRWQKETRPIVREKLYTNTARELWDAVQNASPDDWHLKVNKWLRQPNAGK